MGVYVRFVTPCHFKERNNFQKEGVLATKKGLKDEWICQAEANIYFS